MSDSYNLERFVTAQNAVWARVENELGQGRKTGHWMRFVFPQVAGLGASPMAQEFAISSLAEARAYLADPVLGPRLRKATALVSAIKNRPIEAIFPYPDNLKFRSSMTLFAHGTPDNAVFVSALAQYFGGNYDTLTLDKIES